MSPRTPALLAILLLAHPRSQLHASDPLPCGDGLGTLHLGQMTLQARPNNISQNSGFGKALTDAAAKWTNSRVKATLAVSWSNGPEPALDNDVSEVYFVDNLEVPALTMTWKSPPNCVIQEADVLFRESFDYSASDDPADLNAYAGSHDSFPAIAMHEFGHVLGLAHRADVYNIMGDANTHLHLNDGVVTAYPGEWGVTSAVEIYGQDAGAYEDLGVAHWKRTGQYGAYSLHGRTQLETVSGPGVVSLIEADLSYEVEIGQQVKVEMTLENFGKNTKDVRVGYYLSSNSNLTTQDRFLGSHLKTVNPDTPTKIDSPTLTIPADLIPETDYWIGAIIDDNQQVAEVAEWNNRASIAIRTRELPENLVAVAIGGPANDKAGTTAFVSSNIENMGGGFIPNFTYEIRLSKNTTITDNDPLLGSFQSSSFGFRIDQVTIPGDLAAGDYYWGLRVLPSAEEVALNDNRKAGGKVQIAKGDPDLVAVSISGPAAFEVGDQVTFQCVLDNIGGSIAGQKTFRIYLSQDSDIEPTDIVLKTVNTSVLGTKSVKVTIPALPATGNYRLGMIVSPKGSETSLTNNAVLGDIVIVTSIEGGGDGFTSN